MLFRSGCDGGIERERIVVVAQRFINSIEIPAAVAAVDCGLNAVRLEGQYGFIGIDRGFKLVKLAHQVAEGKVAVNGEKETRKRRKLAAGDRVTFAGRTLVVHTHP